MIVALLAFCLISTDARMLQIEVIAGDGAVHQAGSRSSSGLAVRITDELGAPVAGALVSFHMPEDGPSGAFTTGLGTEIVTTGADGRAVAPRIIWNDIEGTVEIRITAAKDGLRAGAIVTQQLAGHAPVAARHSFGGGHKWLYIAGAAAGAAALGFAVGRGSSRSAGAPGAPNTSIDIGAPTITIGNP